MYAACLVMIQFAGQSASEIETNSQSEVFW